MGSDLTSKLAELRAELLVLRAAQRALAERVVKIENRTGRPTPAASAALGVERKVTPAEPPLEARAKKSNSTRPGPVPLAAELVSLAAPDAASSPEAEGARSPEQDPEPHAAPRPEPHAAPKPIDGSTPLTLPTQAAIFSCLKQLLGIEIDLEFVRQAPPIPPEEQRNLYACVLVDDAGRDVGAVVANAAAAARLGGALLGLPDPVIEEQVRSERPTEEALEAMSEICNNLTGPVNLASPEHHVRSQALVPFPVERLDWLAAPSRSCLLKSRDGACLWLVAR